VHILERGRDVNATRNQQCGAMAARMSRLCGQLRRGVTALVGGAGAVVKGGPKREQMQLRSQWAQVAVLPRLGATPSQRGGALSASSLWQAKSGRSGGLSPQPTGDTPVDDATPVGGGARMEDRAFPVLGLLRTGWPR